jgi:hypothetical protein
MFSYIHRVFYSALPTCTLIASSTLTSSSLAHHVFIHLLLAVPHLISLLLTPLWYFVIDLEPLKMHVKHFFRMSETSESSRTWHGSRPESMTCIIQGKVIIMYDTGIPLQCNWDLHHSGKLGSTDWWLHYVVLGQPISSAPSKLCICMQVMKWAHTGNWNAHNKLSFKMWQFVAL